MEPFFLIKLQLLTIVLHILSSKPLTLNFCKILIYKPLLTISVNRKLKKCILKCNVRKNSNNNNKRIYTFCRFHILRAFSIAAGKFFIAFDPQLFILNSILKCIAQRCMYFFLEPSKLLLKIINLSLFYLEHFKGLKVVIY